MKAKLKALYELEQVTDAIKALRDRLDAALQDETIVSWEYWDNSGRLHTLELMRHDAEQVKAPVEQSAIAKIMAIAVAELEKELNQLLPE